jgi:unsaturated rhamnogalacturonyl hydrolase
MAHQLSRRRLLAGAAGVTLAPGASPGAVATPLPGAAAGAVATPLPGAAAAAAAPSPALPSRADILAVLRRVNDQWIGAHGNPGDNQWARAAYFSGNMALYRATTDARYLGYASAGRSRTTTRSTMGSPPGTRTTTWPDRSTTT